MSTTTRPEGAAAVPPPPCDEPPVRISAWAYLRSMALIAWESFRHPFCTSVIDLETGSLVERY
jgi:hypothetical protein